MVLCQRALVSDFVHVSSLWTTSALTETSILGGSVGRNCDCVISPRESDFKSWVLYSQFEQIFHENKQTDYGISCLIVKFTLGDTIPSNQDDESEEVDSNGGYWNIQLSPDSVSSVPYGPGHITVWEHADSPGR